MSGCSEEEAQKVLESTNDTVEALDLLIPAAVLTSGDKYIPKPGTRVVHEKSEVAEELVRIRKTMETMDAEIHEKIISNQTAGLPPNETHTLHEETALQSNCVQQCLLPFVEEEAETSGTENQ